MTWSPGRPPRLSHSSWALNWGCTFLEVYVPWITRMLGEGYGGQFRSLLLHSCNVFERQLTPPPSFHFIFCFLFFTNELIQLVHALSPSFDLKSASGSKGFHWWLAAETVKPQSKPKTQTKPAERCLFTEVHDVVCNVRDCLRKTPFPTSLAVPCDSSPEFN